MAAPASDRRFTPPEYFAWVAEQDQKYEYYDGEVFAMAGGSARHSTVCMALAILLGGGLRNRGCTPFASDLRVQLHASSRYVYPDLSAVCETAEFLDDDGMTLLNPTLVVEVLSTSTEAFDLGTKAQLYRDLPSLQALLYVRQDTPSATLYLRAETGWTVQDWTGLDARLDVLGVPLALAEVYDGVTFDGDASVYDASA